MFHKSQSNCDGDVTGFNYFLSLYVTDIAEQVYFLVNGNVLSDHRPKADETSLKIPE